ncbi:MAG: tRNA (adenosine(37)-N6)-dimethylallyltransferase MiaA [Bacteroidales bacterium]
MTKNSAKKTLVVITGPTAVGKTNLSLDVAADLDAEIVSADARQFYRELVIGTAAPTARQLAQVPHHLVGHLSIHDYYNVSMFEEQTLGILHDIFLKTDYAVLTGGSGMYIDALCQGIDILPEADIDIRNHVKQYYQNNGLDALRTWLRNVDPVFYQQVDLANPNRIMRGVEVFLMTGQRFSELRIRKVAERPFTIKRVILNRDRQELYQRINLRVDEMMQQGLVEEVITFFNQRHLNALNTVGYKEIFAWLSGQWPLHLAVEKIKTNTRRYAKRQLTWFRRYEDAQWFAPDQKDQIMDYIRS